MSPEQSAYRSDLTIDGSTGETDALMPADSIAAVLRDRHGQPVFLKGVHGVSRARIAMVLVAAGG